MMLDSLIRFDKGLFFLINEVHSPFFDTIMTAISGKGILPFVLAPMLIVLFEDRRWKGLWTLLFMVALVTLADQLSVHGFKDVFMRLRPCHDPGMSGMVHIVDGHCGGMYGFVSSHAANTFAVVVFYLSVIRKRRNSMAFLLVFYAILVCYSRIYLGVHFPGDVLGGALLGTGLGLSFAWLHEKLMQRIGRVKPEAAGSE